ncbi:MAG: hypothetical protein ABL958_14665 [Bdellovibrionia bacterium]
MKIFVLTFLLALSASAGDFSSRVCIDEQAIAEELVRAELSGLRLAGRNKECLDQSKYKFISVDYFTSAEANSTKPKVVSNQNPIRVRVSKLTPKNERLPSKGDRRADYFQRGPAGKEVQLGTLYFHLYRPGSPMHRDWGCAASWSQPKNIAVFDNCVRRSK